MNNVETVKRHRGWFIFLGIVLIIAGTAAILAPMYATLAFEILIGWILVFAGIGQLIHCFGSKSWGVFFLRLLGALLYLAAGVLLLFYPLKGMLTLTLLLAILLIVQGIFRILSSFQIRHYSNWGWLLVGGLLSLALGLLIYFQWPSTGLWVLGLFLGIDLIFAGWTMVMLAMAAKKGESVPVTP